MKTYLWIEDRKDKSGHLFWQTLMNQLCPEIVMESKKNSSELVKAVKALEDTKNRYIVVFDNSFDNLQVAMEQKLLRKYVSDKGNVFLMDIICFEYLLLEFKDLIEWIYTPDDVCGLDASRLQLGEKMKRICEGTSLLKQFQNIGLEVVL